ncbi:hypothetical protein HID58_007437 [Brassica napus]|uniref:BnaA02g30660D protein n=2 Tax=Brassica napus TaxID=3708 RepID=A0A078H7S6_BRANA|nr:uncharacterized protein LOC106403062 isoform X1 [Brassica napus]KAH0939976.1 hypothetical protein HID58_007437 [Brassica napus]CAF2144182.1 unnamed protein product [Brassica napus]CDY33921.1 BnaA02g30660D [Brassica napus]
MSSSIARTAIRGENRFYNPPAMRRMQQEAQLQQQLREKQGEVDNEPKAKLPQPLRTRKSHGKSKNRVVSSGSEVSVASSESSGSGRLHREASNLDRFLEHTTPFVPAMRSKRELKTGESESSSYFVLEDLWESFAEWSAYGAGVPLHMDGSDSTVQYYVPYLSGIQLYVVDPSNKARNKVEDNEGSSHSNSGKTLQSEVDLSVSELNRVSLGDQSGETEITNPQGRLLFEYLEYEPPFGREPLANKVSDLASRFPELMTYKSCDLSPSSWVSVSWYPIYRIPVGATLQNLDACFLTFHSLSTPPPPLKAGSVEPSVKLPLPTFGLASYKLKLSVWNQNRAQECQKISSLQDAADKWLKCLQVNHPDYKFFTSNITQTR